MQSVDIYKQNKTKLKKENLAHAVQKKTACGEFGNQNRTIWQSKNGWFWHIESRKNEKKI